MEREGLLVRHAAGAFALPHVALAPVGRRTGGDLVRILVGIAELCDDAAVHVGQRGEPVTRAGHTLAVGHPAAQEHVREDAVVGAVRVHGVYQADEVGAAEPARAAGPGAAHVLVGHPLAVRGDQRQRAAPGRELRARRRRPVARPAASGRGRASAASAPRPPPAPAWPTPAPGPSGRRPARACAVSDGNCSSLSRAVRWTAACGARSPSRTSPSVASSTWPATAVRMAVCSAGVRSAKPGFRRLRQAVALLLAQQGDDAQARLPFHAGQQVRQHLQRRQRGGGLERGQRLVPHALVGVGHAVGDQSGGRRVIHEARQALEQRLADLRGRVVGHAACRAPGSRPSCARPARRSPPNARPGWRRAAPSAPAPAGSAAPSLRRRAGPVSARQGCSRAGRSRAAGWPCCRRTRRRNCR